MYRMKYGKGDGRLKEIILTAGMSGKPAHHLVVESVKDTYGDIKDVVRSHIEGKPLRHQLVLMTKAKDEHEEEKIVEEDDQIITVDNPLILQLFLKDTEWGGEQLAIIDRLKGGDNFDLPRPYPKINLDAFIWGIEHSPALSGFGLSFIGIKTLVVENAFDIRPIMPLILHIEKLHIKNVSGHTIQALTDVLPHNTNIKSLIIENPDETANQAMRSKKVIDTENGLFMSIMVNNTLERLIMIKNVENDNVDYKMTDLSEMLSINTSLKEVVIDGYRVKINKIVYNDKEEDEWSDDFDGDLEFLAETLNSPYNKNFKKLIFRRNPIEIGAIDADQINASLGLIRKNITGGVINSERGPMLDMTWTNPDQKIYTYRKMQ